MEGSTWYKPRKGDSCITAHTRLAAFSNGTLHRVPRSLPRKDINHIPHITVTPVPTNEHNSAPLFLVRSVVFLTFFDPFDL